MIKDSSLNDFKVCKTHEIKKNKYYNMDIKLLIIKVDLVSGRKKPYLQLQLMKLINALKIL